jgi:uncharacterized membrane protein
MKSDLINGQFDPIVDNPENYRLGIFYFNRKDKRTIVPKRNRSLGWTINFARPYAYWGVIMIVAIFSLALVLRSI